MNPWDLLILGFDHGGWMGDVFGFKNAPPVWLLGAVDNDCYRAYDKRADDFYSSRHGRD